MKETIRHSKEKLKMLLDKERKVRSIELEFRDELLKDKKLLLIENAKLKLIIEQLRSDNRTESSEGR